MQGTLFAHDNEIQAFVMPESYREPHEPGNIKVVRFFVFTDPCNNQSGLAVKALSSWLDRTKNGYFDRVGGDPDTGKRCTEFIIISENKKAVINHLNTLGLIFSYGNDQSMMAREKRKLNKKSVKIGAVKK